MAHRPNGIENTNKVKKPYFIGLKNILLTIYVQDVVFLMLVGYGYMTKKKF